MRSKKKLFFTVTILLLIAIQFYRPYKVTNYQLTSDDLLYSNTPTPDVSKLLKTACYDCHSNQTSNYWYANIAPMAWLVDYDIKKGRSKLNFSQWESYSKSKKIDLAGAIMLQMYDGKMPLPAYTFIHKEARLTKKQQNQITEWINSLVE